MSLSPWTIRPKVLLLSIPVSAALIVAGCLAYHPIRVWMSDGVWRARFSPDGTRAILYGSKPAINFSWAMA
ncbi:hypothetical protein NC981_21645 [Leptolyngbya sp. DQ-M1]|uniref:hypothetical protein n=1 Tax=Leptolyngbya sp. DQ-M1 TaxID=2933920 RepID=UPI003296F78C